MRDKRSREDGERSLAIHLSSFLTVTDLGEGDWASPVGQMGPPIDHGSPQTVFHRGKPGGG